MKGYTRFTRFVTSIVLTASCLYLHAASGSFCFTVMDEADGFPSRVNCVFPEDNGPLWAGTDGGLYRYDGYLCRKFSSITHLDCFDSSIKAIGGDDSGALVWVMTPDRILIYDKESGDVEELPVCATSICRSKDGLLIGTENELKEYDFNTGLLSSVAVFHEDRPFIPFKIIGTDDGSIICASHRNGIRRILRSDGTVSNPLPEGDGFITTILLDSRGRTWLGFYNHGVRCYSRAFEQIATYNRSNSLMSNDIVLSMDERQGRIWMATDGGGVNILNPLDGDVEVLRNRIGDSGSIPYDSISTIETDSSGNVWAIRVRGGLFTIRETPIHLFKAVPPDGLGLSCNSVLCLHQGDSPSSIWIGTDGGGVNLYDSESGRFRHFPSTSGMKVASITDYSETELMVSVFSEGLYLFDKQTGGMRKLSLRDTSIDYNLLYSGDAVNLHAEDPDNILILSDSPYRLHTGSGTVEKISAPVRFASRPIAVKGKGDRTFFYDQKRLYSLYRGSDEVRILCEMPGDTTIRTASTSGNGMIWLAGDRGIHSYNLMTGQLGHVRTEYFEDADIIAAGKQRIWIGTENSLFMWSEETGSLRYFGTSRNVPVNQYWPKAGLVSTDGNVYLGGTDGLLVIDKSFSLNPPAGPDLRISEISADDRLISGVSTGNDIKLKRNTETVTINFFTRGDNLFDKRLFLFRINGGEAISQYSPTLTLRNLHHGKYLIEASCTSINAPASPWSKALSITIPPPWYKSELFFILLTLLATGAMACIIIRIKSNAEKDMKQELDEIRRKSEDEQFLLKLDYAINDHISDPDLDIDRLCMELGISHTSLFNKVKQASGRNVKEYIDDMRMRKAMDLVRNSGSSFVEISEKTGFSSSRYFSTFFKKKTGMTPTEYRKTTAQ